MEIMKLIWTCLLSLFLASCTVGARGNPEIFQLGELEVRLYQDREKMARDLPVSLTLWEATRVGGKQINILGYYDRQNKRIYSVDDARVVIHEFKHYLEPDWRHEIGDGLRQEERTDGVGDCAYDETAN
jgi:hypothetical protein